METTKDFDERYDVLIYTTIAEEYQIFAASQEDAVFFAADLARQKWRKEMVVRHEVVPIAAGCYKGYDGTDHPFHDNGDNND